MSKTVKEVLIEAKSILKERGRGRKSLVDQETGCPCLLGAVGLASGVPEHELQYDVFYLHGDAHEPAKALAYQLDGVEDPHYSDVYVFNDNEPNDDEVFALIDRAIEAEG